MQYGRARYISSHEHDAIVKWQKFQCVVQPTLSTLGMNVPGPLPLNRTESWDRPGNKAMYVCCSVLLSVPDPTNRSADQYHAWRIILEAIYALNERSGNKTSSVCVVSV